MPENKIARLLGVPVSVLVILAVYFLNIPNPVTLLFIPVALFAYLDGYIGGFLSGGTVVVYAGYYFLALTSDKDAVINLIITILAASAVVVLLGRLKTAGKRTMTQLKQTQEMFLDEETRVKLMLDATPLACTLRDKDFKVFECNEEAVRLFGVKDKREFTERFQELSPEYQPDGQLSSELAAQYIKKAYEEGKYVFEWTHRTIDGTLFPAEITLIRAGLESNAYTTVGYTRDLRGQKRMMQEIEQRGSLLDMINQVSGILLQSDIDSFETDMLRCLGMIGKAVNTDRVSIWKNYIKDGRLYCSEVHEWVNSESQAEECELVDIQYDSLPGWEKTLSKGDCINLRISGMSPEERKLMSPDGVLSLFAVPVFDNMNQFWGIAFFDNCHEERIYSETEQTIMRLGSLSIANALVRHKIHQRVYDTAALLQTMVENYMGIVWYVDSKGIISLLNGSLKTKIGIIPERIVGKKLDDLSPGLLHPDIVDYTRKTFTKGAQDFVLKTKFGAFHIRTSLVYGDDGVITGVVGNSDEITEILRLQDELEEALDEANKANTLKDVAVNSLERILNSIDAMIYTSVPETGELLFVNDYMKALFNKSGEDLTGQYCYKVFRSFDAKCDYCPCHKLKDEPEERIVWDSSFPGLMEHVRHSDWLIDWPNGEKVHLQHAVDVSELVSAKESAEQSNHSKGIFIAQMSHEIRTPMNAILGISEIQLRNEGLSSDAEEGFKQIYDSGNLLLNIINDILDFSKIDAGKMEIVPNKYDIPSLVNDTVQLCRLRYESKPITFNLSVDENTPLELIGDELRIRQILNNLLSNAFKYTDEGEVKLTIYAEPKEPESVAENVTLVFQVSDTGQGMSKEQVDRIFEEYSRFNMQTNQGIPGTGLGMTITKHLVDLMSGEIFVKSEVNKGSVFTVRLPQKECGSVKCGVETVESLRNFSFSNINILKRAQIVHEYMPYGRVLVVDDVESNLYVAKGLLIPYGLRIEAVKSGVEAVNKIKSGEVYDVVLMDHMMPGMDGIKATKILRDYGYTHPIVALTANAMSGQSEMFLSNGFDRFISKPIDSRELDLVLMELIRDKQPPEILEAARREKRKAVIAPKKDLSELEKYFVLDAENTVNTLESIYEKIDDLDGADIQVYTVAVHGIKSALRNIGETKLSDFAFKLEKAGGAQSLSAVADEIHTFIKELKTLIAKLKSKETSGAVSISRDDMLYLKVKLNEFKTTCEVFDIRAAKAVLNALKQKTWSQKIDDTVNEISVSLLRGEFKKAASVAEKIINTL